MLNNAHTTTRAFLDSYGFGLFSTVDSLMSNETRPLNEGLPTLAALIGLLPRVNSQVLNEARVPIESFPTLFTFIGSFSGVDSLVLNQA